jgi:hypothetical protein
MRINSKDFTNASPAFTDSHVLILLCQEKSHFLKCTLTICSSTPNARRVTKMDTRLFIADGAYAFLVLTPLLRVLTHTQRLLCHWHCFLFRVPQLLPVDVIIKSAFLGSPLDPAHI